MDSSAAREDRQGGGIQTAANFRACLAVKTDDEGLPKDCRRIMRAMKGVRIGRSSISGRGLFATKTFECGDRICEYTGRLYWGDTYPDKPLPL